MADKRIGVVLIGAEIEENLAIRYLAAVLSAKGHLATITPCCGTQDFHNATAEIRRTCPQLVAISIAFQTQATMYLDLAEEIRREGFDGHIIVGGHFPTFEFQRILEQYPAIDSVGRFDGEETISALADTLATGADLSTVPNLVYRCNGGLRENACRHAFPDLDALPFPVRTAPPRKRFAENVASLVSSRGCWHSACLYCCIGAFHRQKTAKFSLRSPENVAHEIAELVEKHGVRVFQFQDDNFILATRDLTLSRLDALSKALRAADVDTQSIALFIKARPDAIDEHVGDALRGLGCTGVFLGIENASKTGLASLIRAAGIEHIEHALAVLRARDIAITYNLLIFHPNAKSEEYQDNVDFVSAHPEIPFDIGRAEIVAGSPLEKKVRALGLLRGSWPWWDYVLADPAMNRRCDCFRYALRQPDSSYGMATFQMIDINYHSAVLTRLCPGPAARSFAQETESIIRTWNETAIHAMKQIAELSEVDVPLSGMDQLRAEIEEGAKVVQHRAEKLRISLSNYQRARKTFRRFGVEDAIDDNRLLRRLLRC